MKKIKSNHIFSSNNPGSQAANKSVVHIQRSNLLDHKVDGLDIVNKIFVGKDTYPTFAEPVVNRKKIMRELEDDLLKMTSSPDLNIYKQVEMYQ